MGTSTSLMYSPISSGFMRFSMLSLTFCSWPDSVWMTNHWLCIDSECSSDFGHPEDGEIQHLIDGDGEHAEQDDGNHHQYGRAFQFVNTRPGTLAQLFARLEHVVAQLH